MKFLAPYLAIAALGVHFPTIPEPRFVEVPSISFTSSRRTGIAASRRAAKKRKNRRKSK